VSHVLLVLLVVVLVVGVYIAFAGFGAQAGTPPPSRTPNYVATPMSRP